MATPVFQAAPAGASAASNADLSVPLPTANPAGWLLIAVVASYTAAGAPRVAPPGWVRVTPNQTQRIHVFTRIGVAGDAGGTVIFPSWTSQAIGTKNSGLVVGYSSAVAVSVVSSVASATNGATTAPTVRSTLGSVKALEVFVLSNPNGWGVGFPNSARASYLPTDHSKLMIGVSDQTMTSAGVSPRVSASVTGPSPVTWRTLTMLIRDNAPPLAPTLNAPNPLYAGTSGLHIDATQPLTFSWQFNDPDSSDVQLGGYLQWSTDPSFATGVTTKTFLGTTPDGYTVPAGTFTAGSTYYWRVQTEDENNNFSPWSTSGSFRPATPPAAPTITAPTGGATVTSPTLHATFTLPTGAGQFQVQRLYAGQVVYDSGPQTGGAASAWDTPFDVNSRDETVRVRCLDTVTGLWSVWTSVTVHVAFTPPAVPSFTLSQIDPTGLGFEPSAVQAVVTNPPGGVTAVTNELWRQVGGDPSTAVRIDSQSAGTALTDWLPPAGTPLSYQVRAVAADTAAAVTSWYTS